MSIETAIETERTKTAYSLPHALLVGTIPAFLALLAVPLILPRPMPALVVGYPRDAVVLWLLARPVVAGAVVLDCRIVSRIGTGAELDARRWALLALALPFVTAVRYLSVRHERVTERRRLSRRWPLAVLASLVGVPLLYAYELAHVTGLLTGTRILLHAQSLTATKLVGALLLVALPVAVYTDGRYLRAAGARWQPNPGRQLGLALVALAPVALLVPVYVAYYLYRRPPNPR